MECANLFLFDLDFIDFIYTFIMCIYMCVGHVHVSAGPQGSRGIGSLEAGVSSGYELPHVGAGNKTRVLCERNYY